MVSIAALSIALNRVLPLRLAAMREDGGEGAGGKSRRRRLEERVCANFAKKSKVWLFAPSTLKLGCSQINAKLREFVQGD